MYSPPSLSELKKLWLSHLGSEASMYSNIDSIFLCLDRMLNFMVIRLARFLVYNLDLKV